MATEIATVILLFMISCAAMGQNMFPKFGACPSSVQPMLNFDINQFSGKWYVTWLTPSLYEWGDKCSTMTVARQQDGAIKIDLQRYNEYGMTPDSLTVFGNFYDPQRPNIGRMDVDFTLSNDIRNQIRRAMDSGYYILGTDYKNFAVMFNCLDLKLLHVNKVIVLSRQSQYNQQRAIYYQPNKEQPQQLDANAALPPNVKQWLMRLPTEEFSLKDLVMMQQNCGN